MNLNQSESRIKYALETSYFRGQSYALFNYKSLNCRVSQKVLLQIKTTMRYAAKRCGLQFSPPAIVLIYENTETTKVRKRIIPVRNFSKYSGKAHRLLMHVHYLHFSGNTTILIHLSYKNSHGYY